MYMYKIYTYVYVFNFDSLIFIYRKRFAKRSTNQRHLTAQ